MFFTQKDAMLREYQSEIEKLKQMIEKGGFEGGEVVPSEVTPLTTNSQHLASKDNSRSSV